MPSNRRAFLTGAAGLAAGAPFILSDRAHSLAPLARSGPPGIRLSLAGYSLRKEFQSDPPKMNFREDFMKFAADNGVGAIEPTSYYFPKDADRAYFMEYRRQAFLMGLSISGTAIGNVFTHPEGPERNRELQLTRTWIDHAATLGAPCIRIFAGNVREGSNEAEARQFTIDCIRQSLVYAAHKGIFLALENHGGIVSTADQLISIVEEIDSDWFGVNLDTGNFHSTNPYADLERVAPYAVNVQVKVEMRPEGKEKGPADLARIVEIMRDANYRGYVALEYEADEDARTAIPGHLAELRRLIG